MFPDFVDAKDVRHRWKPLLRAGGKENRSGPEGLGRPADLTAPLPDNLTVPSVGAMNVWTACWSTVMQLETKYLRLSTAVTLGSRFGDWRVCWRGGWSRHRLLFLGMFIPGVPSAQRRPNTAPHGR